MNTNEILEGNKLIAEFMNNELIIDSYSYDLQNGVYKNRTSIIRLNDYFWIDKLTFHCKWDWLIPVIDKITSMDIYFKYKQTLGVFNGGIEINTKFIISTFKDVLIFIKWYNLNNK